MRASRNQSVPRLNTWLKGCICFGVMSVLTLTQPAYAANASKIDFKGLQFGIATADDVRVALLPTGIRTWICTGETESDGSGTCTTEGSSYANTVVAISVFSFTDGKLTSVYMTFPSDNYQAIVAEITRKYGLPTSRKSGIAKNLAGATLPSESVQWAGPRLVGSIQVDVRRTRMDEGSVTLLSAKTLRPQQPPRAKADI